MIGKICTESSILSPEFQFWCSKFNRAGMLNRKAWEWAFIAQTLKEHGVLQPNMEGLAFAVGGEPLVSCFASLGPHILATDLDLEKAEKVGWADSNQHAINKDRLNCYGLCDQIIFNERVDFEPVDMNAIPDKFHDKFDFVWSSCALEHLGSIQHGTDFIIESIKCLKKGGVAVHTTEYNVSSNSSTLDSGPTVLFRRRDIEHIMEKIHAVGCISDMDFDCGTSFKDYHVDIPPYGSDPHLKLMIQNYTVTSIGMVIVKPGNLNK